MLGGLPGNSFVLMEFEEGSGLSELAPLALGAFILNGAELVEGFLELPGETAGVKAECGKEANAIDKHVELSVHRGVSFGRQAGGVIEGIGFESGDAVEAPRSIHEFVDELGFGGCSGFVFVEEFAAMIFVSGAVFRAEEGGGGRQPVGQSILGRTLLAGLGARAGRVLGVGQVDRGARL
jgi:hypothetical protein